MGNQDCNTIFDRIYHQTYNKTLHYVTARCGNHEDISDIVQEVYAELFRVLAMRGSTYVRQPEAFVMRLARTKVYRHYSLRQKIKNLLPTRSMDSGNEEDDEVSTFRGEGEPELLDLICDRDLLREIGLFIKSKPGDVQRIFFLHYVLEQTTAQIASDLHLQESTVKSKLRRTVLEIRTIYGKVGNEK